MNKLDILNIILQSNTKQTLRRDVFSVRFSDVYTDFINYKFIHDISDWPFTQQLYHYFYDDFDLKIGLCLECGKRCKFINFVLGYRKFCSKTCANNSEYRKSKVRKTNLEKYGSESYLASERFKEQYKQICQEKYGTDNAYQAEEVKEKIKQKCLEKYGTEYASQSEEVKEKIKQTKLEKYGDESFTNREKAKQTCLEKYGHEYYTQTDEYKEKYDNDEFVQNKELKRKNTCLEKYGVDNYSKTDECRQKVKQTSLEKYGTPHYSQTDEYTTRVNNTCLDKYNITHYSQTDEYKERVKQTCLEKYGHEYYTQTDEYKEKSYNTKKKNNSFHTSKIEEQIKSYLNNLGINYEYQYTSEVYPFTCDFYFPDYDLYVEIQGSWTHGRNPFTGSEEDLKLLEKWKSKNTKYYDNAIQTWTIRDVLKREIAKQNNLNFLEIFSCDFDTCINEILKHI